LIDTSARGFVYWNNNLSNHSIQAVANANTNGRAIVKHIDTVAALNVAHHFIDGIFHVPGCEVLQASSQLFDVGGKYFQMSSIVFVISIFSNHWVDVQGIHTPTGSKEPMKAKTQLFEALFAENRSSSSSQSLHSIRLTLIKRRPRSATRLLAPGAAAGRVGGQHVLLPECVKEVTKVQGYRNKGRDRILTVAGVRVVFDAIGKDAPHVHAYRSSIAVATTTNIAADATQVHGVFDNFSVDTH
jgi:hypothetical protein